MTVTNNDILKVDVRYTVSGIGVTANIFQAQVFQVSPHTVTDAYATASMFDWIGRIYLPMVPHIVVTMTDPLVQVYKKVGVFWNLIGSETPTNLDGESIGDPLPSGVALLTTVLTDTSKVQGKKYIGGLSETGITAGLWIATVLTAMGTSAVQWIAQFQDLADEETWYIPGVYSTKAIAFKMFTSAYTVRSVPAYQRRRKSGVGA